MFGFYLLVMLFLIIFTIYLCILIRKYQCLNDLYQEVVLDNDLKTMEIRSLKQDLKTYKELLERNK